MSIIDDLSESRINAAEIAITAHTDVISRTVFTDEDPAQNLSQLLTSLQAYATKMGINFQAACDGDDENFWTEPEQQAQNPAM